MKQKTIAIDIDNVLSNFSSHLIEVAQKIHNKKFDIKKWVGWSVDGVMTKQEYRTAIAHYTNKDEFVNQKPIQIKQAREYIKKLVDDGWFVEYLTCRDYRKCGNGTEQWIDRQGLFFKNCKIGILPINSEKFLTLNYNKYDVAIDDRFDTLQKATGVGLRILFDTPHNRLTNCEGVERFNDWGKIYDRIKGVK